MSESSNINRIDVGALKLGSVTIVPEEHADDRSERHKAQRRQALLTDIKDFITFCVILIALIAIGGFSAYKGVLSPDSDPATQRWCQSVLTVIVTGGVSFVLGRNSKGK